MGNFEVFQRTSDGFFNATTLFVKFHKVVYENLDFQ
jgi:hypothetical protein